MRTRVVHVCSMNLRENASVLLLWEILAQKPTDLKFP